MEFLQKLKEHIFYTLILKACVVLFNCITNII